MNLEDCSDTSFCSNDIPSPVVEFCFVSGDFKDDGMSSNGGTAPSRLSEALSMVALKVDNTFLMSYIHCLLYTSPSPRDKRQSRMPSSA